MLLFLAANIILYAYYSIRVSRQVAALRRAGEPVMLADIRVPEVPDSQNAWLDYKRIFHLTGDGVSPSSRSEGFGEFTREQLEAFQSYIGDASQDQRLRQLLREPNVQRTLTDLQRAAAKPYFVKPPTEPVEGIPLVFPHWGPFRACARVFAFAALEAAGSGDVERATELLLTGLQMSRQVADDQSIIAQLVSWAMYSIMLRALETVTMAGGIPAPQSAAISAELQRTDLAVMTHRTMALARASEMSTLTYFQRHPTSGVVWLGTPRTSTLEELIALALGMNPAYWKRRQWMVLRLHDELAAAETEPPTQVRMLENIESRSHDGRYHFALSHAAVVSSLLQKISWTKMQTNMAVVALALNDYYLKHGRYPDSLQALQSVPQDPYSGRAFRYQRHQQSFLLYSIGPDRRDGGGIAPHAETSRQEGDVVWASKVKRR